jgi:hypothetical protein
MNTKRTTSALKIRAEEYMLNKLSPISSRKKMKLSFGGNRHSYNSNQKSVFLSLVTLIFSVVVLHRTYL